MLEELSDCKTAKQIKGLLCHHWEAMPEKLSLFRWPEAILGLLGTHCVAAKTWTSTLALMVLAGLLVVI